MPSATGLKGNRDLGDGTLETYRILINKHLVPQIGVHKIERLSAARAAWGKCWLARSAAVGSRANQHAGYSTS